MQQTWPQARVLALTAVCLLLSGCVTTGLFTTPGIYPVMNKKGKVVAQIETAIAKPEDVPPTKDLLNPVWWLQCGGTNSSFKAPLINNGLPYLPGITNQTERDLLWWLRNPACNFVGFIIGFEGVTYKVTGTYPVLANTLRDVGDGSRHGWKWSVIDGWAPFVSYWNGKEEFYLGWRPLSGGFGAKFVIRH